MATLHQFQFSHFCEKARWALDYKGVPFAPRNLLPGLHLRPARKIAPSTSLPILVDGDRVVQDSTAILDYLDERYPLPPLTPLDAAEAEAARRWEETLDEEVGVTLRLWFYFHTLPRRGLALGFLSGGAPWWGRPALALMYPKLRVLMSQRMDIHAESAARSMERLLAAFDRLDEILATRSFLVGDRFSRADLTACALLAPLCAPGRSENELAAAFPAEVIAFRDQQKKRPYFRWVDKIYREYRHPVPTTASVA